MQKLQGGFEIVDDTDLMSDAEEYVKTFKRRFNEVIFEYVLIIMVAVLECFTGIAGIVWVHKEAPIYSGTFAELAIATVTVLLVAVWWKTMHPTTLNISYFTERWNEIKNYKFFSKQQLLLTFPELYKGSQYDLLRLIVNHQIIAMEADREYDGDELHDYYFDLLILYQSGCDVLHTSFAVEQGNLGSNTDSVDQIVIDDRGLHAVSKNPTIYEQDLDEHYFMK